MMRNFTLEYWIEDGWYIGRLREVPGVFSQGETVEELKENIRDAYSMINPVNIGKTRKRLQQHPEGSNLDL